MTVADIRSGLWKKSCGPFPPLALSAAVAWLLFAFGGGPLMALPVLCAGQLLGSLPGGAEFVFALTWLSPTQLARSWVVMLIAMMLPFAVGSITHVRSRSFRHERILATWAFLLGYFAVWMGAALPLIGLALFLRLFAGDPVVPLVAALFFAIAWQTTPWKQFALNKCHARPPLAAFGTTPFGSSAGYGLNHGLWCLANCSPIMLVTLVAPSHSQIWMVLAAMWIWAERLEAPRKPIFHFYIPNRALRTGRYLISQFIKSCRLG